MLPNRYLCEIISFIKIKNVARYMPRDDPDLLEAVDDQLAMLSFWEQEYPLSLLGTTKTFVYVL